MGQQRHVVFVRQLKLFPRGLSGACRLCREKNMHFFDSPAGFFCELALEHKHRVTCSTWNSEPPFFMFEYQFKADIHSDANVLSVAFRLIKCDCVVILHPKSPLPAYIDQTLLRRVQIERAHDCSLCFSHSVRNRQSFQFLFYW